MPRLEETAYPRLKRTVRPRDLASVYTPTWDEARWPPARPRARAPAWASWCCSRPTSAWATRSRSPTCRTAIVEHIARSVISRRARSIPLAYDAAGTRRRHLAVIREYLRRAALRPGGPPRPDPRPRRGGAHQGRPDRPDQRGDRGVGAPALRAAGVLRPLQEAARKVRAVLNAELYRRVFAALPPAARLQIDALFIADLTTPAHPLERPESASRAGPRARTCKELIAQERWLSARNVGAGVPGERAGGAGGAPGRGGPQPGRGAHDGAGAAQALHAGRRAALPADGARPRRPGHHVRPPDAARSTPQGKQALAAYREEAAPRTDALVGTLRDLVVAHGQEGTAAERLAAMDAVIGGRGATLIEECDAHLALAGSNYYPFLWRCYRG